MYLINIVEAAGWPIWTIIFASVIALAIILERLYTLRRTHVLPNDTYTYAVHAFQQKNEPESHAPLWHDSPLGQVLQATLQYYHQPTEWAKGAIESTGHHVAHQLSRYLNALGTVAAISPLLGLLGTVIGMIEIFSASTPNNSNPAALAHGISIALYNTAFGIIVAVPSLMFYRYFRSRVDQFLVEMERQAFQLIEALHNQALYHKGKG